jgi:hypothetical protein
MADNTSLNPLARAKATFPQFRKLPVELRIYIWMWACFQSRTVIIKALNQRITSDDLDQKPFSYRSTTSPPPVMHACQESRNEAQQHYTTPFNSPNARTSIFTNLTVDIICPIGRFTSIAFQDLCGERGVQTMALGVHPSPTGFATGTDRFFANADYEVMSKVGLYIPYVYVGVIQNGDQFEKMDQSDADIKALVTEMEEHFLQTMMDIKEVSSLSQSTFESLEGMMKRVYDRDSYPKVEMMNLVMK